MNSPYYWDVPITVSGGQGQAILNKSGTAKRTVVTGPNGFACDLAVYDKDSKPITGRTSISVLVEEYDCLLTTTYYILNATIDGAYNARVWRKPGAI